MPPAPPGTTITTPLHYASAEKQHEKKKKKKLQRTDPPPQGVLTSGTVGSFFSFWWCICDRASFPKSRTRRTSRAGLLPALGPFRSLVALSFPSCGAH
ncbi:hypothetical protein MPTK1_1g26240 [Marchantia polymorpha subsp. ruderalis]|uniref:Uncharacterized protein n=2 Tax=Marchantia polymorpha TaxID=3197 RepID=A0AAF6AUG0_MARPO|nr:hypothetical protein MARPO_0002s0254 [Marchantia polymorpha]BBN00081.1 hypothetical protein Mp_1g26240 [Marchantia polymorpha subsp. ruderalis]|eukprot:PTQ49804.1 hypothetical protein MARPO_0002s0254 [Marchantia polymorpha]